MSEQEQYNTPEDPSQQAEKPVDVMSLKKIDMTREDYDLYSELYPDDPQVAEFMSRYGIVPGESIVVSATDPEDAKNNFFGVIETGDDLFTTNRALTTELEDRLLEVDSSIDQESTPEQAERIVSSNDIKELGETALESAGIHLAVEAIDRENTIEVKSGLTAGLAENLASRLVNDEGSSREGFGRRSGVDMAAETRSLFDAFRKGAVSKEDLVVLSSTLLGASRDRSDIEGIFSMMKKSEALKDAELKKLSTQLSSIAEANSMTRPQNDRMKISYINSLITRAQGILDANDRVPNDQYRSLLGLITGLSTRVTDRSASQNFTTGALRQLRKVDTIA